jgi:predicted amidohydrolase
MAAIQAKSFRLALLQLGSLTASKSANIDIARKAVQEAAASTPKPHLIVLPEIWNSPYAVSSFREYSELVPDVGTPTGSSEGETVKALREMAKSAGCWLIGGELTRNGSDGVLMRRVDSGD